MPRTGRQFTLGRLMAWVALVAVCCALGPFGVAGAVVLTTATVAIGLGSTLTGASRSRVALGFCAAYPWLLLGVGAAAEWWERHRPPYPVGPGVFTTASPPDSLWRTLPGVLLFGLPLVLLIGLALNIREINRVHRKLEQRGAVWEIVGLILIPTGSWIVAFFVALAMLRGSLTD